MNAIMPTLEQLETLIDYASRAASRAMTMGGSGSC